MDSISGINTYDIQYKVSEKSLMQNWHLETIMTSMKFGPTNPTTVMWGDTFYFRARARDNAGNLKAFNGGLDFSTSTYVEGFRIYPPFVVKQ